MRSNNEDSAEAGFSGKVLLVKFQSIMSQLWRNRSLEPRETLFYNFQKTQ